jgi:hypothetical protein
MRHVFAESNWVVDCFAPRPFRTEEARSLLERAQRQELMLHVPSVCLSEGATVIREKFQPKAPDWHRFRREALETELITQAQSDAILRFFEVFRATALSDLSGLDAALDKLRRTPGVDVFALDDAMLERAISLRSSVSLKPFDEAILGAVLTRAETLRSAGARELVFCTLDGDLRPRPRTGQRLLDLYTAAGLHVRQDFLAFEAVGPG